MGRYYMDRIGRIEAWCESLAKWSKLPAKDVIGKTWHDIEQTPESGCPVCETLKAQAGEGRDVHIAWESTNFGLVSMYSRLRRRAAAILGREGWLVKVVFTVGAASLLAALLADPIDAVDSLLELVHNADMGALL